MSKRTVLLLFIAVVILTVASPVSTPQIPGTDLRMPTVLDVRSEDWKVRRSAFGLLIGATDYDEKGLVSVAAVLRQTLERSPGTSNDRTIYLIELLENENRVVRSAATLSEEYVNYYGDVIAAVSNLNDIRSLNALLGAITTGGMATGALISFGPPVVEPVARLIESPDQLVRSSAMWTLTRMLEPSTAISKDPKSRSVIKQTLLRAASDRDPIVRRNAVEGLVRLGDEESIAVVERIAREDPYQADYPGKEGRYIVREVAEEALRSRQPN